jgi:Fur family transcriptional regulator, ferric uptake regulator
LARDGGACPIFLKLRGSPHGIMSTTAHRVSTGERINAHEGPGRLRAALEKRGVRLTRQRKILLEVMGSAERHLDAEAILERAQKLDPRVHRVTVYRTIDLLKRSGLIDELDLLHLRGGQHFYESHGPRDHIHVACLKCGTVREFESELYEKLKKQIEKDCGIEITTARTEVGGYCEKCRKK